MELAESDDGIHWTPYKHNPILTLDDLPWGTFWQTPFVILDPDEKIYKMWFVSVTDLKIRGRDAAYPAPPAQFPASGTTALGSYLGC
jgi:hypothetical protein